MRHDLRVVVALLASLGDLRTHAGVLGQVVGDLLVAVTLVSGGLQRGGKIGHQKIWSSGLRLAGGVTALAGAALVGLVVLRSYLTM